MLHVQPYALVRLHLCATIDHIRYCHSSILLAATLAFGRRSIYVFERCGGFYHIISSAA